MKKILVAGATGYLGRFTVRAMKEAGYYVRVLVRSREKLGQPGPFDSPVISGFVDEVFEGDVTDEASLVGVCEGVDYVFSSVGITRQKGPLTFDDVDFLGNIHLLKEAERCGVARFMYINVYGAEHCPSALTQAKHKFVQELKQSAVPWVVVNPTGYFSDLTEVLDMAKKGRAYLLGSGHNKMNPIHGADLAAVCVDALDQENVVLDVGGPDVYTYREIADLAFDAVGKRPKRTILPKWLGSAVLPVLRVVNKRQYDLVVFFFYMMTHDVVAERYGSRHLGAYFLEESSIE
ncbi:SDR family oxidoreductase [Halobacillus salinus]|uniref:SDR family oxidoreductase n=1 Tax=Halobacillus salinus TaxID=192814 RepID=UPI0009A7AA02|nr:SDR family oxidoreductase [Halobacillus salinus]